MGALGRFLGAQVPRGGARVPPARAGDDAEGLEPDEAELISLDRWVPWGVGGGGGRALGPVGRAWGEEVPVAWVAQGVARPRSPGSHGDGLGVTGTDPQ